MIAEAFGISLGAAGFLAAAATSAAAREQVFARIEAGPARAAGGTGSARDAPAPRARGTWGPTTVHVLVGAACAVAGLRWAGPAGAIAAGGLAFGAVQLARRARAEALGERDAEGLREVVTALADAVGAGLSVRRSLEEAARDAPAAVGAGIARALARLDVGEPLDVALEELTRVGGSDAALLSTLLAVHARTGGDLPGLLAELADLLGGRAELRGRVRALTAQGRASATVLAILPVGFVALLSGTGEGGLGAFYRTPLGGVLLLAGLGLDAAGFLWLRRIARGESA